MHYGGNAEWTLSCDYLDIDNPTLSGDSYVIVQRFRVVTKS